MKNQSEANLKESGMKMVEDEFMPFMDTFYALSSDDGTERTFAASSLLQHIFFTKGDDNDIDSIIKDGLYAMKRLITGLCSGRGSARQGYASCLSSFLRLSFTLCPKSEIIPTKTANPDSQKDKWITLFMKFASKNGKDISTEGSENLRQPSPSVSCGEYVRSQLLCFTTNSSSTDSNKPKKGIKGIEERDQNFGLLFGLLAVIRSGILCEENSELIEHYIKDILNLYESKDWMREPAARALMELFSTIHLISTAKVLNGSLSHFFDAHKHKSKIDDSIFSSWTAEKIAVYLHLQNLFHESSISIPQVFQTPILTKTTLTNGQSSIVIILRNTSRVVHPRCHLVWNTIWSYLTESASEFKKNGPKKSKKGADTKNSCYKLKSNLPFGNESAEDILNLLIHQVILSSLLGVTPRVYEEKTHGNGNYSEIHNSSSNATNERRALALSLIEQVSSFQLSASTLENIVLQPEMLRILFINTLQSNCMSSSKKNQSGKTHTLQPLAHHILRKVVESLVLNTEYDTEESQFGKRLAVIKALVKCDPSFDSLTKTNTISVLLGLDYLSETEAKKWSKDSSCSAALDVLHENYISFLEESIIQDKEEKQSSKIIEVLFQFAKRILRQSNEKKQEQISKRILSFFLAGAFYNVNTLDAAKDMNIEAHKETGMHLVVKSGVFIRQSISNHDKKIIRLEIRKIMAARFHSLLSDTASLMSATKSHNGELEKKTSRAREMFSLLSWIKKSCDAIEKYGASLWSKPKNNPTIDAMNPEEDWYTSTGYSIQKSINMLLQGANDENKSPSRAVLGIVDLILSLYFQLLSPGGRNDSDNVDMDELEDNDDCDDLEEEVKEFIVDLFAVVESMEGKKTASIRSEEDEINPLELLLGICSNIFKSPLGGDFMTSCRAGGTKLVRECVKIAWTNSLLYAADASTLMDSCIKIDKGVIDLLLESVCGFNLIEDADMNSDATDSEIDDEDSVGSGSREFNDAHDTSFDPSSDVDENSMKENGADDEDSLKEDVELDPSSLENMLLEDSDAEMDGGDGDVLEHHAGADAALVELIKVRQEASKAGQSIKEKIDISRRLRSIALLESLLNIGLSNQGFLSNNNILMMVVPLLTLKGQLEKSLVTTKQFSTEVSSKRTSSHVDKLAFSNRLVSVLQNKLFKLRFEGSIGVEDSTTLAMKVLDIAKKSQSPIHNKLYSSAILFIMKAVSENFDNSVSFAKEIYVDALNAWSSKKATKLTSLLFDDLVSRNQSVATVALVNPLSVCAQNARSAYLKGECFRLISTMFSISPKEFGVTKEEVQVIDVLKRATIPVLSAFEKGLKEDKLMKAKHIKKILKCSEKLISFNISHGKCEELWDKKYDLKSTLSKFFDKCSSPSLRSICANQMKKIEEKNE